MACIVRAFWGNRRCNFWSTPVLRSAVPIAFIDESLVHVLKSWVMNVRARPVLTTDSISMLRSGLVDIKPAHGNRGDYRTRET